MENYEQKHLSRQVPVQDAATLEQVQASIDGLRDVDLIRLEEYALWRIRGLGRRALGRTHEDLLYEAISATLLGRRTWNKTKVNFVGYLIGAMQSISNNWANRFNNQEPFLESELYAPSNQHAYQKTYFEHNSIPATQEQNLLAKQQEEIINKHFEDDPLLNIIICELKEGMKLQEIREKYNIQDNEYQAAIKRMKRKLARLYEGENYV